MLKTNYLIGCLAVITVLASCKKSTSFNVTGDPGIKYFANIISPGTGPQNAFTYNVVNIPNSAGSGLLNLSLNIPASIKFPVYASSPTDQDATVQAQLDTTLIAAYNTAHNTKYLPFPAGILKTDGLVAHIAKGTTSSLDSITINTDITNVINMTGTLYMAPIKLISVSGASGSITTTGTTNIAYVVVNVEQRRIKFLATTTDVIGALLTPRTTWTSVFTPAVTTVGSIFDGSLTTFSKWAASPGQLDVNMLASKNVTGIRLYTATSATYVPSQVDVYLSSDGINYDHIGAPLKANLTYSTYNYILFYKAIPAQYIRLILSYPTSTNTQDYRVTEFDVYGN